MTSLLSTARHNDGLRPVKTATPMTCMDSCYHKGYGIHLRKGQKVARVQAANEVPQPHLKPGTLESLKASENPKSTLSVAEHKEKLMAILDLSGLDQWPQEKAKRVHKLLMEYHDIFSLDNELGCASQVKHNISDR